MENDPLLARIRNLLAKAESTTFPAEAEAFTAKAQELMTRHAIDMAVVAGAGAAAGGGQQPVVVRVHLDAPYVGAKSSLLSSVAAAGRCQAVFHPDASLSSVVGFPEDVAAVEVLFTSLLVQAQMAMADAARHAPPGTRVRSRGYRSAFIVAFAHRIGERLRAVNEAVMAEAEAEYGSAFLPVLRERSDEVDQMVTATFGRLSRRRIGAYDAAGWAGGTSAADRARLAAELRPDAR